MSNLIIQVKNISELIAPKKAYYSDACYDIYATSNPKIVGEFYNSHLHYYSNISYIEYSTNLFVKSPDGYFLELRPRSSISNYNLILANSPATIDNGFRGEILVRFKYLVPHNDIRVAYNSHDVYFCLDKTKIYKKEDRIAQLRLVKQLDCNFEFVDNFEDTTTIRGKNGFGSSDKK